MTFATSKLKKFLPPAIFAMATEFITGLSDSIICGNILGENALGAVNLLQGVFEFVSFISLLVAIGACVLFATEVGAAHVRRAKGYFTLGAISAVVLGLGVAILLGIIRVPFLSSFGASQAVYNDASTFLLWFLPAAFFQPLAFYLATLVYADGNPKLVVWSYVAELVFNCLLSIPLTMYFGVAGCACGTGIGFVCATVILMFHFSRKGCMLGFSMHFRVTDFFRIVKTSVGDASKCLGKSIMLFALNAYFISKFGSDNLPILAVVVMTIATTEIFDGLSNAIQPLVSVYVGENNTFLTRRVMRLAIIISFIQCCSLAFVLAVYPQVMLKMAGLSSPELVEPAMMAVRISSGILIGIALTLLFNSYYVFIGREILSTVLTVLSMCIAPVVGAFVGGNLCGINGMCVGLVSGPLVTLLGIAIFLIFKYGIKKFPYLLSTEREDKMNVFDLVLTPEEICETSRKVEECVISRGLGKERASKAALLVEETLMVVRDKNSGKKVISEIILDFNDDKFFMIMRDDGIIFNLTDADAQISSLRVYLVSNLMLEISNRRNLVTTGFNRNTFRL